MSVIGSGIVATGGGRRGYSMRVARSVVLVVFSCAAFGEARATGEQATRVAASQPAAAEARRSLLIVGPKAFASALEDYVRFRQESMPTRLAVLESILSAGPGVDDAEKVKRYLFGAWKQDGVGYVLLVGDADVMPVRYMVLDRVTPEAFDYAFYPSDLYYADLARTDGSFDDWNAVREGFHAGYFGEVRGEKNKKDAINFDQIDYRPDVAVGRWPVSTAEELRTVIQKNIDHDRAAGSTRRAPRAGLICVGGWVDARDRMEGLAAAINPRWTIERRFYADAARNDKTPPPNETEVVKLLNEGVDLVVHSGHGTDDAWAECLSVACLERIRNAGRLPVMISAGCSTARFATLPPYEAYVDIHGVAHAGTNAGEVFKEPPPPAACYQKGRYNMTGLGEQFLRRGGSGCIAYIGCNTGSQPCGLTLAEGFVAALARRGGRGGEAAGVCRVGDCWSEAIAYYYERERLATIAPTEDWYPASIFFQGMKFMLFGDPTTRVGPGAAISVRRK